jgi:hypothetical protein
MPGAAYNVNSPLLITMRYPALAFGGAITALNIPVPAGWVASVRGIMAICTTTFVGATTNWGVIQVGDGTTVNKFGQLQTNLTAAPFTAGQTKMILDKPPPLAGLTAAGLGTSDQSGMTGRNPANAPVSGVSGSFLFASSTTGLVVSFVVPSGAGNAGVADVAIVYELSDVG